MILWVGSGNIYCLFSDVISGAPFVKCALFTCVRVVDYCIRRRIAYALYINVLIGAPKKLDARLKKLKNPAGNLPGFCPGVVPLSRADDVFSLFPTAHSYCAENVESFRLDGQHCNRGVEGGNQKCHDNLTKVSEFGPEMSEPGRNLTITIQNVRG